ncbi:MAG TPA: LamG domain-containing protein [Candidatus Nanoarchaeia archaeon]|nr:LamG domain-containing protein [Candidatus Nanoarchaeia archaeon]
MNKKIILCAVMSVLLAGIALSQETIQSTSDKISYKGIDVTPYTSQDMIYNSTMFDWVIDGNSFYPEPKSLKSFGEFHYLVNRLKSEAECEQKNQYYADCSYYQISFDKFIGKNNITKSAITQINGTCGDNHCVIGNMVSFYGAITNLDPEFELRYSTSTSGFYNQTEATANGIRLSGANLHGDFRYYVYYNGTSSYWGITLGNNASGGNNITLQTRTADSYNISDIGLISLWGLNDDPSIGENATFFVDSTGRHNGTCSSCPLLTPNGTVGSDYTFNNNQLNLGNIAPKTRNLSISLWINFNSDSGGNPMTPVNFNGYVNQENCGSYTLQIYQSGGTDMGFTCGDRWYSNATETGEYIVGNWYHLVINQYANGSINVFKNNIQINPDPAATSASTLDDWDNVVLGRGGWGVRYLDGKLDEIRIYNRSLSAAEVAELYNLGSYHIEWNGGEANWSSATTVSDGIPITTSASGKFMQFKANLHTNDTSVSPYLMNHSVSLTALPPISANEAEGRTAIETGINNALISPAVYTDKQIYLRNKLNNQDIGTFDKVAVKGSQRWAINYITTGESYTNMFNITPVVYVLEMTNLTSSEITTEVENFINSTRS